MRPGTRSSAQSHNRQQAHQNSNHQNHVNQNDIHDRLDEYASSPPEGLGMEFEGREAVRLQRFSGVNAYTPKTVPTGPFRIQNELPRRIPHQSTTIRDTGYDGDNSASEETSSLLPRQSNKLNMRDGRIRIRPRGCSLISFILACLSITFLGLVAHSFLNLQRDAKGCRMSFMYPSYAKLSDFDTEHTRFATKYSLYLYREQKMDLSMEALSPSTELTQPNGVPVLFIPGNAGSYRQVRPIAAEAAAQFFHAYKANNSILQDGIRNLDFFTVDFNEDFSAFHGQTLLDQAEYLNEAVSYILSLYHETRKAPHDVGLPDPQSVIIVGHSMGGIVARAMLTMPNYLPNSINTIITMAAPHALPPAPFDWEMQRIYNSVNGYWRKAYAAKWANNNPLWHVTLISIAGGGLDNTVASDYTATSSIVPMTNGFTVYTSTVPGVWTGMDHQAILWCDQFRKVVAKSLLDVVDVRRSAQTKSRAERMQVFRKAYLSGLEDGFQKTLPYGCIDLMVKLI
jgi:GPI inositol-deacylase